jgi:NADH:ubiquinone reductase (H+-translocating)
MAADTQQHRVLIIGGGFGGVSAALQLHKHGPDIKVTLLTNKPYLEYYAALYRIVTGRSPMEACVSYRDIFEGTEVEVVIDRATGVDMHYRTVRGESGFNYHYDSLILAVGSETAYFNIPGMKELSHGMKSATEALELKRHIHEIFDAAMKGQMEDKVTAGRVVIIGGGASGVELAGELAVYARQLAVKHGMPASTINIDLIEAMPRLLPLLSDDVSARVLKRLQSLGVNVLLNRAVVKEELETVYLKDMQMKTKTVVWTAGLKACGMIANIEGMPVDKRGRAEVDETLQAKGRSDVYVIGDAASTKYSGMAQTAVNDGNYVANVIARKLAGKPVYPNVPKMPIYAVPVGPRWAIVVFPRFKVWGLFGWRLRRAADMKVFLLLLPPLKAIRAYVSGDTFIETCPVCCSGECVC